MGVQCLNRVNSGTTVVVNWSWWFWGMPVMGMLVAMVSAGENECVEVVKWCVVKVMDGAVIYTRFM